ncbi:MAG: 30S ribosomal protein S12 methylthiotransferase RimO [Myxococcota bacterium]|nr:30S ribosomal protein S12 methylthiotransferase RimO [Myxococcota bacterium]
MHFVSLGCPKNRVDTETMLAGIEGDYQITTEATEADVVVVNTCAFVESAKEESVNTILDMAELKESAQLKKLIVSGCLSQRYSAELAEEMPEIDHLVGTNDLGAVREILDASAGVTAEKTSPNQAQRLYVSDPDRIGFDWELSRVNTMAKHSAYLKIAEGCSNKCAFCIIPKLRGPQRSRTIESVLREAEGLAAQGVVELNLIAQDLTAYGYDLKPRSNLTALLDALEEVEGIRWIRLFYAYPRSFPKGLIEKLGSSKKVVPYLDIPIQHISDNVLSLMRRGTRSETIRRRIQELREKVPQIAIRTTFLVGYPGETEEDHQELLAFVRESKFERVGAFIFSREEGTPSYSLPDQVPEEIKERRYNELMFAQREVSRALNESLVGSEVEVMIERVSDESDFVVMGRTAQQAPEIDGVTYLGLHERLHAGKIIRGIVTQVTDYDLAVELLDEGAAPAL